MKLTLAGERGRGPRSLSRVNGVLFEGLFLPTDELQQRAGRASAGLAAVGVGSGDTVALLMRNDVAFLEASLAAGRVGAAPVPINWHGTREEINYVLSDSRAKVLVAHSDLLAPLRPALPPSLHVRVVPTPGTTRQAYHVNAELGDPGPAEDRWSEWVETPAEEPEPVGLSGATMFYTSGTTGNPKGVRRVPPEDAGALVQSIFVQMAAIGVEPGARTAVTAPLYHSAPNAFALAAVGLGTYMVLESRFDPEGLLRLIEEQQLTHLYLVPTMFVRLLKLPEQVRSSYDLSSLKRVTHGAAPCPDHVKQAMIDWWGPIVEEFYGGTEIGVVTASTSEEWLSHPGTVGRPLQGVTIKVLDPFGEPVGVGEPGEVFARMAGFYDFEYENRPGAREEVGKDDLVTVGDIGYLDDDGFLYLCDRKRDMVISGGANIYPIEIEACLITMPGVRDVAVFGIPDEEFGEALAAVIEPEEGADIDRDAVRAFVRQRLAGFKVPRIVEFEQSLPREDSGKIFKRKLREPYWVGTGRSI